MVDNKLQKESATIEYIKEKIKKNQLIKRYIMLVFSLFLSALVFNIFIIPTNIVSGGVNGISIILKYIYEWEPSITILMISSILLLFSIMYLGIEKTTATVVATLVYPLFVRITSNIPNFFSMNQPDLILISIFIGVIGGFANGIMYKTGFTNCGLPIISQILHKELKISIAKSSFIMNSIIILIGGFFFGYTMVLYAFIILYINSFMLDRVILGVSKKKAFYIITEKDTMIKEYIINTLKHSVTIFDVKGGFLHKKRKVLLTVIPSREYFLLTTGIKEIDKNAFFIACNAYEVAGGK